jgi:hypothetical protein
MRAGILNAILHSFLFFYLGMLSHALACQTTPVHAQAAAASGLRSDTLAPKSIAANAIPAYRFQLG